MSRIAFNVPQRQSIAGIALIFTTTFFHLIRNFWAVGAYFLVMDASPRTLFLSGIALGILLLLVLGYSVAYYLKFLFHIDEEENNFVLQKGVFNSDVVSIPLDKIQQVNFRRNILQRVIGVYSVVIDTAGSQEQEVEIKALSKEKADILAERLSELSIEQKQRKHVAFSEEEKSVEKADSTIDWEYKLKLSTLLKLGLTSNYLRGLSLLFAFYFTVRSQFENAQELPTEISLGAVSEIAPKIVIFLVLLAIVMVVTVIETFVKYFGLHLIRNRAGLQVEMGLRNNTRVNLEARRVQLLQEVTNPIQQYLNLYKLKVSLSSSRDDLDKNQIKIPGLTKEVTTKVKDYFYGKDIKENYEILPSKLLLYRSISVGIILLWAVLTIAQLSLRIELEWFLIFFAVTTTLLLLYQYYYFKSIKLIVSDEFLIKYSGIWIRKKKFLEMYKLQAVSISQPIWYQRRDLVSLSFSSAGGNLHYTLVRKKEVLPLLNYLLFKIKGTSRPWM